jgi:hypothetical protein
VITASLADLRSRLEQAALARAAGAARVRRGGFRAILAAHPVHYTAITATDLPEHLTKPEVLPTFDDAAAAAALNLTFAARKGAAIANPAEGNPA